VWGHTMVNKQKNYNQFNEFECLIPGNTTYSFKEKLPVEKVTRTPLNTGWYDKTIIPFFGCSFTYGQGMTYDNVFTNIIQNKLSDNYMTLNIGSPGGSMDLITRIILQYYNRVDLKNSNIMVVNLPPFNRREHFNSKIANYNNKNWRNQSIYDGPIEYRRLLPNIISPEMNNEDWRSYIHLSSPATDRINLERNLVLLSNFGKVNNIKVFLWRTDCSGQLSSADTIDVNQYICDLGLETISIPEIDYDGTDNILKYTISQDDAHFNQLGNTVIADSIYNSIKQYLE